VSISLGYRDEQGGEKDQKLTCKFVENITKIFYSDLNIISNNIFNDLLMNLINVLGLSHTFSEQI